MKYLLDLISKSFNVIKTKLNADPLEKATEQRRQHAFVTEPIELCKHSPDSLNS